MRSEFTSKLFYGPSSAESTLIVDNDDGEGGGFDVYHGSICNIMAAAQAIEKQEAKERVARVEAWKKYKWQGAPYTKHWKYTILVIHPSGLRDDLSLPEENTGL